MLNEHIISCAPSLKTHTRVQISLSMRSGTQGEDGAERLGYAQQFVLKTGESLKISEWGHEQSGDQESYTTAIFLGPARHTCMQIHIANTHEPHTETG